MSPIMWAALSVGCLTKQECGALMKPLCSYFVRICFRFPWPPRSSGQHRVWCYTGVETKYPPNIKYEIIKTLHVAWRPLHLETAHICLQIFSSYLQIFSVHWEVCGEFISTRPVTKNVNMSPGYEEIVASSRETWGISEQWSVSYF